MARVTVQDCLENVHNRFALVLLVAKRTKQLLKGATPTVPAKDNKNIVRALREVAENNVSFIVDTESGTEDEQIERDLCR